MSQGVVALVIAGVLGLALLFMSRRGSSMPLGARAAVLAVATVIMAGTALADPALRFPSVLFAILGGILLTRMWRKWQQSPTG